MRSVREHFSPFPPVRNEQLQAFPFLSLLPRRSAMVAGYNRQLQSGTQKGLGIGGQRLAYWCLSQSAFLSASSPSPAPSHCLVLSHVLSLSSSWRLLPSALFTRGDALEKKGENGFSVYRSGKWTCYRLCKTVACSLPEPGLNAAHLCVQARHTPSLELKGKMGKAPTSVASYV